MLMRNGLLAAMLSHTAFSALAPEPSWGLNRVGLVLAIAALWFVVMRCLLYALVLTMKAQRRVGEGWHELAQGKRCLPLRFCLEEVWS